MPSTITTSTSSLATRGSRMLAVTSTGRIWAAVYDGANSRYGFWYSDNNGSTWTENTSARISISSPIGACLFIDVDGHAHFAYTTATILHYTRMASIGTSTSWGTPVTTTTAGGGNSIPSLVAFRDLTDPGAWFATILRGTDGNVAGGTTFIGFVVVEIDAAGSFSIVADSPIVSSDTSGSQRTAVVDFRHSGDGRTIAASTPDLFVAMSAGVAGTGLGVEVKKLPWTGAGWSGNSDRALDDANYADDELLTAAFDGTRQVVAWVPHGSSASIKVAERDAADTTTTTRTPPALSDGFVTSLAVGIQRSTQDIYLFAVGTTSDDPKYVVFDRSAGTWGSWTTIEATNVRAATLTSMALDRSGGIAVLYTDTSNNVRFERFVTNQAPTASTWVSPGNNAAADVAASLLLDWDFNDPDDSDTQSAYALERVVNGGSAEYYNAGGGTWGGTETKNTSTTSSVTLASSWASDGDSVVYRVKTWDALDTEGVYSSGLTVRASAKVDPTLTAPTDAGTIASSTVTATWTVSEQTAYRVRILTAADAQLFDTGKVTSSVASLAVPYNLTDGTSYKVEVRTWNADDLESNTDTHSFDVDFVEPATPTLTVTAQPASGRMVITVANPSATGSQPDVVSHDLFVRVASGGVQDGERTVGDEGIRIATGVAENGTAYDYAAGGPGVNYEYRVLALADNGTSVYSAWEG